VVFEGDVLVVVTHDEKACFFNSLAGVKGEAGGGGEGFGREFLQEQVGNGPQITGPFRAGDAVQPVKAEVPGGETPGDLRVGVPLPLQAQGGGVKLVVFGGCGLGKGAAHIRFGMGGNRFTAVISVGIAADHRPVVDPGHGIEVDHPAIGPFILKMKEPEFAAGGVDPSALVGAVHRGVAPGHDGPGFIGSPDMARPKDQLPAVGDAPCRGKKVIPAITFVKLGSFDGRVLGISVEDHHRLPIKVGSIGGHPVYHQYTFNAGAAACKGIGQIGTAIVIPQRGGINQPLSSCHQHRLTPGPRRMGGFGEVYPVVRIGKVDVEFLVMVSDAGGPYPLPVLGLVKKAAGGEADQGMADESPVDQVTAVEHR